LLQALRFVYFQAAILCFPGIDRVLGHTPPPAPCPPYSALPRPGNEPRLKGTQQDRGFGSATRLLDRAVDHSRVVENMAERGDSNPAYNVVSIT
jgi:hypothetical protein